MLWYAWEISSDIQLLLVFLLKVKTKRNKYRILERGFERKMQMTLNLITKEIR